MSAILKPIETPSLSEQLGAVRKQIEVETGRAAAAHAESTRCEREASERQAHVDRVPEFERKLIGLHERAAAGDQRAAKDVAATEHDVAEVREMAQRAGPAVLGLKAAARKFEQQAADVESRIAALRRQARDVAVQIGVEMFLASRAEYRRACETFVTGPLVQHFATARAAMAFGRELGLTASELLQADLHDADPYCALQATLSNSETIPNGTYIDVWSFHAQAKEPLERRSAEILAQLRSLALPA